MTKIFEYLKKIASFIKKIGKICDIKKLKTNPWAPGAGEPGKEKNFLKNTASFIKKGKNS